MAVRGGRASMYAPSHALIRAAFVVVGVVAAGCSCT
jgi:hypothetical protein